MQNKQHVIKCMLSCDKCMRTSGCNDLLNVQTGTKNPSASQCHFQRRVSTQKTTMSGAGDLGGRLEKARGNRGSGGRPCLSAPPWNPASALQGPVHRSRYLRSNIRTI